MTDAERLRELAEMRTQWDPNDSESKSSLLRRAADALERLAAIDGVLRGSIVAHAYDPDLCPPEADVMAIRKLKQIHGEQVIDALIAQDLLPKTEVAADGK